MGPAPRGLLDRGFYLLMALLVIAVVVFGFSFTVEQNLLRPAVPRPLILYVHAAVFFAWLLVFALQAGLVFERRVSWHRRVGVFGGAVGLLIPALGVATALAMGRFNVARLGSTRADSDLLVPLFDMAAFAVTFGLALRFRTRPESHRRLMLVSTCLLTAAAFGRFPAWLLPPAFFYAGVDALILLGVVRDLWAERRVHPVYRYVLPVLVVGQTVVMYTVLHDLEYWRTIGRALLR
jgi:hypothetical protein